MVNWGVLYNQGRCKAIGVPWTDEEAYAAGVLHIPANFVRQGCLTIEEYEKTLEKEKSSIERTKKIPLLHLRKNQLLALCAKHNISVTDAAPRASLIECLMNVGVAKSVPVSDVPEAQEDQN